MVSGFDAPCARGVVTDDFMSNRMARLHYPVREADWSIGDKDAQVTVVIYAAYGAKESFGLYRKCQEIGKLFSRDTWRLVWRHFPVSTTDLSHLAAEAAEAAGAQGHFWEMHELLLQAARLDREHLVHYAASLGLDLNRFRKDIGTRQHYTKVREDVQLGMIDGIQVAPAVLLKGLPVKESTPGDGHTTIN